MSTVKTKIQQRVSHVLSGIEAILDARGYKKVRIEEADGYIDVIGKKTGKDDKEEWLYARLPLDKETVGIKHLREFEKHLEEFREEFGNTHGILLSLAKYTHYTRKEAQMKGIETLIDNFPFFNLFDHFMVPKHEFATEEEIRMLREEYSIEINHLPKILVSDPAVQILGARPGDVLKITRNSPTAGIHVTFRHVVEPSLAALTSEFQKKVKQARAAAEEEDEEDEDIDEIDAVGDDDYLLDEDTEDDF